MIINGVHSVFVHFLCMDLGPMKTQSGRKRTAKARKNLLDKIHGLRCPRLANRKIGVVAITALKRPATIADLLSPKDATEKAKRRDRLLDEMRHGKAELCFPGNCRNKTKKPQQKKGFLLDGLLVAR